MNDPKVLFVELDHNGRPFSVIARDGDSIEQCDFDWCKRDEELYYHCSGSGHIDPVTIEATKEYPITYWAAECVEVVGNEHCTRVDNLPDPYTPEGLFDDAEEDSTVYCVVCDDHLPATRRCDHVVYNPYFGDYVGCGCTDYKPEDHKESFFALLETTNVAKELKTALESDKRYIRIYDSKYDDNRNRIKRAFIRFDAGYDSGGYGDQVTDDCCCGYYIEDIAEECRMGVLWLLSLEGGVTGEADVITIAWIDEYLTTQERSENTQ